MYNNLNIIICVPTYKRPIYLKKCIDSLLEQQFSYHYEIIIVDNDLSRTAEKTVKQYNNKNIKVSYFLEERRGISYVRNKCVSICIDKNADFLVFIDDDETAEKKWLYNLIINQNKYNSDIITGPVLCSFEQKPTSFLEEVFFKRKRLASGTRMKNCATGNVLINLNVFDKIGRSPFNTSFGLMGGEDSDFFKRIKLHNIDIVWCDEAIAYEYISKERCQFKACLNRTFYSGNSSYYILKLNSSFLIRMFKIIPNFLQVIISPIFLVLNILFINKLNFINHIKKIFKSLGFISAVFGYRNKQYNTIYGE